MFFLFYIHNLYYEDNNSIAYVLFYLKLIINLYKSLLTFTVFLIQIYLNYTDKLRSVVLKL